MKKGWKLEKLGDVCEIIMGQSPNGKSYNSIGKGVPLINGPVEFSNGSFGETIRSKFTTQPTKLCKEGDLILCVRGSTTGRMNIAGFDACIGRGVAAIRAKQFQPWINHFVSSKRNEIHGKGTGATFPNVSGTMLANFELLMPPLPEQQRIVAILNEAFEAIAAARANAEQNRQNARALFESYLQSVFSQRGGEWEKTTLEKVLKVQPQNGWSPPAANHSDSGTPVLTLSSVTGFQFKADKIKFTSAPTNNMGRYWVKNGDLLITRSNTPNLVGHVAIASDINQPTIYPDLIMRMNPDPERVMTEFLYFQLRTPALRQEIMGRAQGANPTMKKISNGAVKTLPIVVPRLETQSSIAQSLNQLTIETQRLESLYQRKIAALDELKQSLLQQAFSGNL
ncbi:restriction endonuclease subunit S [Aeromonas hydrophila]|uniref:restriction endonuclease subunit S n=1 Tax=Aeromonas hydrophila TaxID=644 RepID=UPI0039862374